MPRRAEHHGIAGGLPGAGMAGAILLADVGFHFHNPPGHPLAVHLMYQDTAKQIAGDCQGGAGIKIAGQREHAGIVTHVFGGKRARPGDAEPQVAVKKEEKKRFRPSKVIIAPFGHKYLTFTLRLPYASVKNL